MMIQLIVAFVLLVALIAGVIWVILRELSKGSRHKRELAARWQVELRQSLATDPRFWQSDSVRARPFPGAAGAGDDPPDR